MTVPTVRHLPRCATRSLFPTRSVRRTSAWSLTVAAVAAAVSCVGGDRRRPRRRRRCSPPTRRVGAMAADTAAVAGTPTSAAPVVGAPASVRPLASAVSASVVGGRGASPPAQQTLTASIVAPPFPPPRAQPHGVDSQPLLPRQSATAARAPAAPAAVARHGSGAGAARPLGGGRWDAQRHRGDGGCVSGILGEAGLGRAAAVVGAAAPVAPPRRRPDGAVTRRTRASGRHSKRQ